MSDSPLREDARTWREALDRFIDAQRPAPLPDKDALDPRQNAQRRVTGGVLLQFFDFLEKTASEELYPQLAEHPLPERVFVFVTDEAGYCAATELMDLSTPQATCVLKEEWREAIEDPVFEDDETYIHHYQFWSVWHRNIPETWDVPELEPGTEYWLHEEGFALADGAGRGAQHLWRWNGTELSLVEETMTSWTS
ncbi:hypothetical protein FRC98_00470 [Lujinxingia vulgaris]|uniref:Uncharacterized protein n=1 Tax=Lujinxingia vulgaris TaxID=2600176 RepID=A0A5C6XJ29_9DELT|nr:hypothetical protein [Lujinxingia vulgaris]TXD38910.1 hypothetical protein FRC98_00470 [Lujinxingia vulgaris]